MRDVGNDEIKALKEQLIRNFQPYTLNSRRSRAKLIKMYLRERAKKFVFSILKLLYRERYSFHFNTIYPHPYALTVYDTKSIVADRYFLSERESKEIISRGGFVWLVLQFSPETSLNYHIVDNNNFQNTKGLLKKSEIYPHRNNS